MMNSDEEIVFIHSLSRSNQKDTSVTALGINFQEEMVLLFFNSMLIIIVDYTEVLGEEKPCIYSKKVTPSFLSDGTFCIGRKRSATSDFTQMSIISGMICGGADALSGIHVNETTLLPELVEFPPTAPPSSPISAIPKPRSKTGVKSTSGILRKRRSLIRGSSSKTSSEHKRVRSSSSTERKSSLNKYSYTTEDAVPAVGATEVETPDETKSIESKHEWIMEEKIMEVKIQFKNGNTYEGKTFKKMMHGIGVFRWSNGTVYEGEFDRGKITGRGKMTLPDLGVYEGDLCQGIFHGNGTFNMQNTPMIYTGSWKLGKKHGKGWMLYDTDNYYDGEWYEDERHGFGVRQYHNGDRYTGHWFKGERHGTGTMMWANNDFYKGEWKHGLMHGTGKYIWRTIKNKEFAFPAQNYYNGNWTHGMRDGTGVMYFGVHNGARLHGTWSANQKEGPGTIICGNGKVVTADRLFHCDKPVHTYSDTKFSGYDLSMSASLTRKQVKSFIHDVSSYTIDLQDVQEGFRAKPLCYPLDLPIHSAAANIDFNYYIEKVLARFTNLVPPPEGFQFEDISIESTQSELTNKPMSYSKWNVLAWSNIYENGQKTVSDYAKRTCDYNKYLAAKKNEDKYMKHLLTTYLPQITELYSYYANLAVENAVPFDPLMIRLFMWQFYIDIGINDTISLIEIDNAHAAYENSGVVSKHDPFEPIHLWQFILSLVGTCWLMYLKKDITDRVPRDGVLAFLFQKFLDEIVFVYRPKTKALCISKYLHLIPLKSVYCLYLEVGNPPTARDFLVHTCVRSKQDPFCGLALEPQSRTTPVVGHNVVPVGQDIMYLPDAVEMGETPKDYLKNVPTRDDPFFTSLKTFRVLGPKRILNRLTKICPQIKSEGMIVDIDYPLTFLEFYEVLILCSVTLIERQMKNESKLLQPAHDAETDKKQPTPSLSDTKHNIKKSSKDRKSSQRT